MFVLLIYVLCLHLVIRFMLETDQIMHYLTGRLLSFVLWYTHIFLEILGICKVIHPSDSIFMIRGGGRTLDIDWTDIIWIDRYEYDRNGLLD